MIKRVGSTDIQPVHLASCHCGAVVLELTLPDGIVDPRRCDCSMCRRRGAIVASVSLSGIRVVQGRDMLRSYQFNTRTAEHFFCSRCGIYTHHQRRSNPSEFGFNVGCLQGVNPFDLAQVPTIDGVDHPSDRSSKSTRRNQAGDGGRSCRKRAVLSAGIETGVVQLVVVAPAIATHVVPRSLLRCHCTVGTGEADAAATNVAGERGDARIERLQGHGGRDIRRADVAAVGVETPPPATRLRTGARDKR